LEKFKAQYFPFSSLKGQKELQKEEGSAMGGRCVYFEFHPKRRNLEYNIRMGQINNFSGGN
jgi:hypothetical protein